MSFHVSSRARPRLSDAPWAYPTNTTAISLSTIRTIRPCTANASHYNFIGPLPLKAVMEILYGVKKFSVNAAISGSSIIAGKPAIKSGTMVATLISRLDGSPRVATTEALAFENQREIGHCYFEPADADVLHGEVEFYPILPGYEVTTWPGFNTPAPFTSPALYIIKDENGEYWMDGIATMALYVSLAGPSNLAGYIDSNSSDTTTPAYVSYTTASLVLACGTYTFRIRAETVMDTIISASLTITATEWFEYRTTAGVAAFSSSTGLPTNGGPGA